MSCEIHQNTSWLWLELQTDLIKLTPSFLQRKECHAVKESPLKTHIHKALIHSFKDFTEIYLICYVCRFVQALWRDLGVYGSSKRTTRAFNYAFNVTLQYNSPYTSFFLFSEPLWSNEVIYVIEQAVKCILLCLIIFGMILTKFWLLVKPVNATINRTRTRQSRGCRQSFVECHWPVRTSEGSFKEELNLPPRSDLTALFRARPGFRM